MRRRLEITSYDFGQLSVGGREFRKDVIILPDRVLSPWWRREGHRLDAADLEAVLDAGHGVLVVGTGYHGNMRVPDETRKAVEQRGIELHVARTPEAVAFYNTMRRCADVVAALHLTC